MRWRPIQWPTRISLRSGRATPDVLARIDDHAVHRLDEPLPWSWPAEIERRKLAA